MKGRLLEADEGLCSIFFPCLFFIWAALNARLGFFFFLQLTLFSGTISGASVFEIVQPSE